LEPAIMPSLAALDRTCLMGPSWFEIRNQARSMDSKTEEEKGARKSASKGKKMGTIYFKYLLSKKGDPHSGDRSLHSPGDSMTHSGFDGHFPSKAAGGKDGCLPICTFSSHKPAILTIIKHA
jgi:hypothetical protein